MSRSPPSRFQFAPARTAVLPFLLGLLACNSTSDQAKPDPEKQFLLYYETAYFHYKDGGYDRAESQALKALEIHPENLKMRLMVPWCRVHRETSDALLLAEQDFRALQEEGDYMAQLGLANTLERLGKFNQEAAATYEGGLKTPPKGKNAATRAAELRQLGREQWLESQAMLLELRQAHPGDRSVLNGLQRVAALLGEYAQALAYALEHLASLDTEAKFRETQLARPDLTELEEETYKDNQQETRQLQLDTRLLAAEAARRLGRKDEAVVHLSAALELEPGKSQLFGLRAQNLYDLGKYREAIADLDQFLRLSSQPFEHPDIRKAYELRGKCEARLHS